jgi:hypothetical protein
MRLLLISFIALFTTQIAPIAEDSTSPPIPQVEIGITSWNIERFDAVGPDDHTFPKRDQRHLQMIAETLLRTGADLIGLQEVISPRSDSAPYSFNQLLSELNRLDSKRNKIKDQQDIWEGKAGKPSMGGIHSALIWNTKTLELLGKVTELTQLKRGYGFGKPTSSKEELRFPRAPLVGRFRVRASPANDFVAIVLHLKAETSGLRGGLDTNDIRRRGEWEELLRTWLMKSGVQGALKDSDIIVMGDMNEDSSVIIELLDTYGTGGDVRNRLIRDASGFSDPRALLLFTSGTKEFPYFTFKWNGEKGEFGKYGELPRDMLYWDTKFLDHILISRSLVDNWDEDFRIDYFEKRYPLKDHIRLSDHRPVSISLRFPTKNSLKHNADVSEKK